MVAMVSGWRWVDLSEYLDWMSKCRYRISLEAGVPLVFVFGIQVSIFLRSGLEYFGLQRLNKNTLKVSCESNGDSPKKNRTLPHSICLALILALSVPL